MIQIIKKNGGEHFQLPDNILISIEEINPMFTKQGSVSLPVTLKYTDHNLRLLNFPQRFDRSDKYRPKFDVLIKQGIYEREATLVVLTVNETNGIAVTFLIKEGDIYNKMKEVTMEEVFKKIVRKDYTGTEQERIRKWTEHMDLVMCGDREDDFRVFPVCTSFLADGSDYLNHVATDIFDGEPMWTEQTRMANNDLKTYYRLTALQELNVKVGDTWIRYPIGYGVSPFLKLTVILKRIFEHFGCTLQPSLFDTDADLKKIVIPNNTIDALMKGELNYGQLVPSCTVDEFMDSVRKKYGCEFFVDEDNTTVKFRFFNDILSGVGGDISEKISSRPVIAFEAYKSLKLMQKKGVTVEWTMPKDYETYQEFKRVFPNVKFLEKYSDVQDAPVGVYFAQDQCRYSERKQLTPQDWISTHYLTSNLFGYHDKQEDLATVEVESTDQALQILYVNIGQRWGKQVTIREIPMPFIAKTRQLNSVIQYNDGSSNKGKTANECPIMHCYAHGRCVDKFITVIDYDAEGNPISEPITYSDKIDRLFFGTTYSFDNVGKKIGKLHLVYGEKDGLYERFWQKYDRVLKTAFQPIRTNLNLTEIELVNFDKSKRPILNGRPLLFDTMKYEISNHGIKMKEVNFRTSGN